jgi:CCR4-NOT transcription complex subunit 6
MYPALMQQRYNPIALPQKLHSYTNNSPLSSAALNPTMINTSSQMTKFYKEQVALQQSSRNQAYPFYYAKMAAATARREINLNNANQNGTYMENVEAEFVGSEANRDESMNATSSLLDEQQRPFTASSTVNAVNAQQRWFALDCGGLGLKNLSKQVFLYDFLVRLHIPHNQIQRLPAEIGNLKQLQFMDISGNRLTILPPELGKCTELKELLLFDNQIRDLPGELGTLYRLELLGLEGNPLPDAIKMMLYAEGTRSVIDWLRDSYHPHLEMPMREWKRIEADDQMNDAFLVMSYNILSDRYATSQMYGYTPTWALRWERRGQAILQEILSFGADIICLQEVEAGLFEDFFLTGLGDAYAGKFWPKSRHKTMGDKEKKNVDGCATFYRKSVFSLVDDVVVEFNQIGMQRPDFIKTDAAFDRFLSKDNIAGIALFKHSCGRTLAVANAHIHWDPEYADVKLIQVAMLTEQVEKLCQKWVMPPYGTPQHHPVPSLLCGDYNSEPDSGVYELLNRGTCSSDHPDLGRHSYGGFSSSGFVHQLNLKSVYGDDEPLFTNFTPRFRGVLDYIWYTQTLLVCHSVLGGIEDEEYLARVVGFPNVHFPSDHISIVAALRFRNVVQKTAVHFPGKKEGKD